MLQIHRQASDDTVAQTTLTLPFELRQKSRLRTKLDDGRDVGLFMQRGQILRHGQKLLASDGTVVEVKAALETVSTLRATGRDLVRAAYHLGNRHLTLQIGEDYLRYLHDHVLDEMVEGMGLSIQVEQAPFEPEAGAYAGEPARQGSRHHQH